ncbi:MAG: hypothetical protein ACI81P_001873 [Neolewinella sp.]|jgi:hypothetical protein
MKYLFSLLFLSVLLVSCGETATSTAEVPETMPEVEAAAEMVAEMASPNPLLQGTVEAVTSVGGDLLALPAAAAVGNIDSWIAKLGSMDGTEAIVSELEALKTELTAESIDGAKVSTLLSSLATSTSSLEGSAPLLGTLATVLQAAADKLAGK